MNQYFLCLLQPTIVTLRVCGVWPFPSWASKFSKMLAIVQALTVIYGTFKITSAVYLFLHDITLFFVTLDYLCTCVSIITLIICGYVSGKRITKFLRIMRSIQGSLNSLNIKKQNSPSRTDQICWITFMFLPITVWIFSQIIMDSHKSSRYLILHILTMYVIKAGTACKVRVFMALLNNKLGQLNWHLNYLNSYNPPFMPRSPSRDRGWKDLALEAQWRKTKFIHDTLDTKTLSAQKVRQFNKAHLKLLYAYRHLNSIFSFPLFVLYVTVGLNISLHIFMIVTKVVSYNQLSTYMSLFGETVEIVLISSLTTIIEKKVSEHKHSIF